jgi:hypothetical protein
MNLKHQISRPTTTKSKGKRQGCCDGGELVSNPDEFPISITDFLGMMC